MPELTTSDLSRILRNQAWERAKGELRSILCTFHTPKNASEGQFEALEDKIETFIKDVEDSALSE